MKAFEELFKRAVRLRLPLENRGVLGELECGSPVLLNGWILCGRDATHRKIKESIERGVFSFDFNNQAMYYVGPTPSPPGKVIGSAGPTTSSRMDAYMEFFLKKGLAVTIGKGRRSKKVVELLKKYQGVYITTFGGAGAFLSQFIVKLEPVAWEDMGPEAFFRIKVKDFPGIVVNTVRGEDLFQKVYEVD